MFGLNLKVNGHSLLGVKLSEAQSFLIKTSEIVHMVICDGFNAESSPSVTTNSTPMAPFPRLNKSANGNGNNGSAGYDLTETPVLLNGNLSKLNGAHNETLITPNPKRIVSHNNNGNNVSSSCNYDNLHDMEPAGDETDNSQPMTRSQFYANEKAKFFANGNGNGKVNNNTTIPSTPINPIAQNQSVPITDKSLMNNILNKASLNDSKSQSMFTPNIVGTNGHNNNVSSTPLASVRLKSNQA